MAPFLEVLTRTYKRPEMLKHNQASLELMPAKNWTQTLFVDDVGMGMGAAQAQFASYEPAGEYIWILDDDDMCIYPGLAGDVAMLWFKFRPDVIMVKMDHGKHILPDKGWGVRPMGGHVGCSAYIVHRDIWNAHRAAWASARYESDFDFINAVFEADPVVYWHDIVASKVQRVSKGEPE